MYINKTISQTGYGVIWSELWMLLLFPLLLLFIAVAAGDASSHGSAVHRAREPRRCLIEAIIQLTMINICVSDIFVSINNYICDVLPVLKSITIKDK